MDVLRIIAQLFGFYTMYCPLIFGNFHTKNRREILRRDTGPRIVIVARESSPGFHALWACQKYSSSSCGNRLYYRGACYVHFRTPVATGALLYVLRRRLSLAVSGGQGGEDLQGDRNHADELHLCKLPRRKSPSGPELMEHDACIWPTPVHPEASRNRTVGALAMTNTMVPHS